jgi:hypothetical protein
MKLNRILGLGLSWLITANLTAQPQKDMLDTVNVNCNDKVIASMAAFDCAVFKTDTAFIPLVTGLQENIRKISPNLPGEGNYRVVYQPGKSLVVEKLSTLNKYMVTGDSVTRFWLNNECEVRNEKTAVVFHFGDYHDLLSPDLITCLRAGIDKIPSKSRSANTYNYRLTGNLLTEALNPTKNGHASDMIFLSGGAGLNLVKNQFVVDISAQVGLVFSKKGIMRNNYYSSYNMMYAYDNQNDKFNVNGFLNLGYARNFSRETDKFKWQGIELGLPVVRNGDMFKDNLFRFGVRWSAFNSVNLNAYLYVDKEFKTAYPAVRIGIPF